MGLGNLPEEGIAHLTTSLVEADGKCLLSRRTRRSLGTVQRPGPLWFRPFGLAFSHSLPPALLRYGIVLQWGRRWPILKGGLDATMLSKVAPHQLRRQSFWRTFVCCKTDDPPLFPRIGCPSCSGCTRCVPSTVGPSRCKKEEWRLRDRRSSQILISVFSHLHFSSLATLNLMGGRGRRMAPCEWSMCRS